MTPAPVLVLVLAIVPPSVNSAIFMPTFLVREPPAHHAPGRGGPTARGGDTSGGVPTGSGHVSGPCTEPADATAACNGRFIMARQPGEWVGESELGRRFARV